MTQTFRQAIDAVLTRLRMEVSLATQQYSEDAIAMGIQHKFDVLFDDYWFPQFMTYQEAYVTDGTTGRIVGDISAKVKRFEDLRFVHNDYSLEPLPRAPDMVRLNDLTIPCVQPDRDKTKVFRIIPIDTSGNVYLTYRTKPEDFSSDSDVIDMDNQLIILGTCFDMLEDDGTNPGAADKFKGMFDARVKQIQRMQFNMNQSGAPRQVLPIQRWT